MRSAPRQRAVAEHEADDELALGVERRLRPNVPQPAAFVSGVVFFSFAPMNDLISSH
jgi:hypothetical protein